MTTPPRGLKKFSQIRLGVFADLLNATLIGVTSDNRDRRWSLALIIEAIIGGDVMATDKSFQTTGASEVVIDTNASRSGFLINNPMTGSLNPNAAPIYVSLSGNAAVDGSSFEVGVGQCFPPPGAPPEMSRYKGPISVIGASGIMCPAVELTE